MEPGSASSNRGSPPTEVSREGHIEEEEVAMEGHIDDEADWTVEDEADWTMEDE